MILLKKLLIYTRLGIKALHEGSGHHLDEVLIAGLILAEQDKMVVAVDFVDFIEAGAGGHIDLTADDRLDACLFCGLIELDTAVHDAVVRDGDGALTTLLDAVHKLVDTAGTVQQAVFGMDVEMNEVSPLTGSLRSHRSCSCLLCFSVFFEPLTQGVGQRFQLFHPVRKARFAHGRVKASAERRQR